MLRAVARDEQRVVGEPDDHAIPQRPGSRVLRRLPRALVDDPEHLLERRADGVAVRPAGELLGDPVDHRDAACGIRDDHAVADAGQRHAQLLALAEELRRRRGLLRRVPPHRPEEADRGRHAEQARRHAAPPRDLVAGACLVLPGGDVRARLRFDRVEFSANRVHGRLVVPGGQPRRRRWRAIGTRCLDDGVELRLRLAEPRAKGRQLIPFLGRVAVDLPELRHVAVESL